MKIKKIGILGLGLIGGSIAKAIRKIPSEYFIGAYDKENILQQAIQEKVIDGKIKNLSEVKKYDLVFLCLPVDKSFDIFKELCSLLDEKNIITDVCSIKGELANIYEDSNTKALYIGGHPMTGKEKGGYANSDPLLFENSLYVISDNVKENLRAKEVFKIIEQMGANIVFVNPSDHDEIVAKVSHLPQILAVSLVNSISNKNSNFNYSDFAAGGFRDMTRIASSDFKMWKSIISNNRSKILDSLDKFQSYLDNIKSIIKNSDDEHLTEEFEKARFTRDEIPKDTKGFLTPLHDLYVFVRDEPGVISNISTALFKEDINIKDIELLKVREGTGGTFRLSFESLDMVREANIIIQSMGFETKNLS